MSRRSRLLLGVLTVVLTLMLCVAPGFAQGDDPIALVDQALAYLNLQLGTNYSQATVTNFGWQETFWADTSLNCPQPGQTYIEQMTRGYIITIQMLDTTYYIHTLPTGEGLRLCNTEIVEPTVAAATAAPTQVPSPTPQPSPQASATPVASPQADTPPATPTSQEAQVSPTTQVAPTVQADFDALLTAVLAHLGTELTGTPLMLPDIISYQRFQPAQWDSTALGCPDPAGVYSPGTINGFVTTIRYQDTDYELHTTPTGDVIVLCTETQEGEQANTDAGTQPTEAAVEPVAEATAEATVEAAAPDDTANAAPDTEVPAVSGPDALLIYTGEDGNVYQGTIGNYPGSQLTSNVILSVVNPPFTEPDHIYRSYTWSPDGIYAAFVDEAAGALYVTDFAGSEPEVIVPEGIAPGYPLAWNASGTELAYLVINEASQSNQQNLTIYAIETPPNTDSLTRIIGNIVQGTGCVLNNEDPGEIAYQQEAGFLGQPLMFTWLPDDSFLYSNSCTGSGLVRFDPATGETTVIDNSITNAALSPDHNHVAGTVLDDGGPQLIRIALDSGERQDLIINFDADQVFWSGNGQDLYVSGTTFDRTVTEPDSGLTAAIYSVQLWRVNAAGESDPIILLEQDGRGIGQITEAPEAQGIVFSLIDSGANLIESLVNDADINTQRERIPRPILYYFDSSTNAISRIGPGGQPAFQPVALSDDMAG